MVEEKLMETSMVVITYNPSQNSFSQFSSPGMVEEKLMETSKKKMDQADAMVNDLLPWVVGDPLALGNDPGTSPRARV